MSTSQGLVTDCTGVPFHWSSSASVVFSSLFTEAENIHFHEVCGIVNATCLDAGNVMITASLGQLQRSYSLTVYPPMSIKGPALVTLGASTFLEILGGPPSSQKLFSVEASSPSNVHQESILIC